MRCRTLASSLLLIAGCGGGDAISPPRPVDASESADGVDTTDADPSPSGDAAGGDAAQAPDAAASADAGVACARAPLGEWAGAAIIKYEGAGSYSATRADLRWKLESSEGCIDRYYPTGTVTFVFDSFCGDTVEPGSVTVHPSDGALTINRTRTPVTYEIRGATTWDASITCTDSPPEPPQPVGGPWALGVGTFDGNVLSGGIYDPDADSAYWDFVRVDAPFSDDGPGCVEPPVDRLWGTGFVSGGAEAAITWTRTSTSACTDTFAPSGVATAPTHNAMCTTVVTQPPSAPIASSDGELVLDRYRRPLLVRFRGDTSWKGARTCTMPDGTMYIEHGSMGGPWGGSIQAQYDGTAFSGKTTFDDVNYEWSITRLPPAMASSPGR